MVKNKRVLLIVQPILTSYRASVFDDLCDSFDKVMVYSNTKAGKGFKALVSGRFESVHTPIVSLAGKAYFQFGIVSAVFRLRPAKVFITADFRALSFWCLLLVCGLLRIPVFSHGQGIFDKPNKSASGLYQFLFRLVCKASQQYVCYTDSVKESLIILGVDDTKLVVMHNTLVNTAPVPYRVKARGDDVFRLLFVGRLRENCNLELLFEALILLKKAGLNVELEVVGDGDQAVQLKNIVAELDIVVNFHGAIYSDVEITKLASDSSAGVYPGDAGLSVVHYMSLSLVPVIHGSLSKHMGPEPSYVLDGENGVFFERCSAISLSKVIKKLVIDQDKTHQLQKKAYRTYCELGSPRMAEKLIKILG